MQVFSYEFYESFKNIYSEEHLRMAASEVAARKCSVKKLFFKISLYSQESACNGVYI